MNCLFFSPDYIFSNCPRFNANTLSFSRNTFLAPELHHFLTMECWFAPVICDSCSSTRAFHSPVTLLEQEAGFLGSVLLVALWLVDAVAIAGILPVQVLLEHTIID